MVYIQDRHEFMEKLAFNFEKCRGRFRYGILYASEKIDKKYLNSEHSDYVVHLLGHSAPASE